MAHAWQRRQPIGNDHSVDSQMPTRGQLQVLLLLSACCGLALTDENWVHSGYGSPLPSHAAFMKIGAVCPEGSVVLGMSFSRGGCGEEGLWSDAHQETPDESLCLGSDDTDGVEGLFVELDCRQGAIPVFEGQWTATGVGTPLTVHGDFSRVGATCPPGKALTGVRFDTGGCGLNATSWQAGQLDYTKCDDKNDSAQGLVMEVQCSSYYPIDGARMGWDEVGVGYPLEDHGDFERVGGACGDGSVATGVAFRKGGHGLADVTNWREGKLYFPSNPVEEDPIEGLVLRLLCAPQNLTGIPSPSPPPPRPSTANSLLCTYVPSASTYPVDEMLFEYEAAGLMDLYSNQVEVESSSLQGGTVRVLFLVYGSRESCDLLISLVEEQDESVAHTYFGTRNCEVDYFTAAAPDVTPPPSPSTTPMATPSPEPSLQPVNVASSPDSSTSLSSLSSGESPASPMQSSGDSPGASSAEAQDSDDGWLVWLTIAGAVSGGTAVAALLALVVIVVLAVVLIRRGEQRPYEGISANFGQESRLEAGDDDEML